MQMPELTAITADALFDGHVLHRGAAWLVRGGAIVDFVRRSELPPATAVQDFGPGLLSPGLIDVQVNGGGGVLLNEDPTISGVRRIAEAHAQFGTATLLPTVITDSADIMERAIAAVAAAREQEVKGVVGIHLEGPFIDAARKGAHPAAHIRLPTADDIERLCQLARRDPKDCGVVLLTVAPNRVAPADIERLANAGVVVALGHAEATASQAVAAINAGARGFTHLFNAMSQLQPRAPGMVGAALDLASAYCGLIADGHHVDPLAIRLALTAKGPGRLMLVSDAMPSAAGGPDRFHLQGREVRKAAGRLTLDDGTLAGATITLAEAVRFMAGDIGIGMAPALAMATSSPAAFIGLPELGRVRAGTICSTLLHWPPKGTPRRLA